MAAVVEVFLRCLLVAVMDVVLAQRVPMSTVFVLFEDASVQSRLLNAMCYVVWYLFNASVFIITLVLLFVQARYLKDTFCVMSCGAIVFLSFALNEAFVQFYQVEPVTLWKYYYVSFVLCLQFTLASIFALLRSQTMSRKIGLFGFEGFSRHWSFVYHLLFLLTPLFYLLGVSTTFLEWVPLVTAVIPGLELIITVTLKLPDIVDALEKYLVAVQASLRNHGVQQIIESHWVRLRVPTLLQIYWVARIAVETGIIVMQENLHDDNPEQENTRLSFYDVHVAEDKVNFDFHVQSSQNASKIGVSYFSVSGAVNLTQSVLLKGCDGVIPLLGMTTIVTKVTYYIGMVMAFLVDSHNEEDAHIGTMCGILFFVLALQTGLTRLEPSKRLIRLYRNFCLLSTAISHFVHSMVHPILMTISVSKAPRSSHARVLGMCAFLISFSVLLLVYLWSGHTISPWLLAVTAFSTEVVIKVIISLLIYTLFMIDSRRDVFWEKLDDYIYYIKATGNSIEFVFGIFLFCSGGWILLFESGGMIRAVMMCFHAYFNIWMQAREGWRVFIQRRSAVRKIRALPDATQEQIVTHNDVCAICYQDLETAKVTPCRHMFHSVCLRKWLYHQDRCPMCHKQIYDPPAPSPDNQQPHHGNEAQARHNLGNHEHEHMD